MPPDAVKETSTTPLILKAAFLGMLGGALMAAAPVVWIYKGPSNLTEFWQQTALYAAATIAGAFAAAKTVDEAAAPDARAERKKRRAMIGGFLFVFLYIASSVLCHRIRLGVFPEQFNACLEGLRDLGLVLAIAGLFVQAKTLQGQNQSRTAEIKGGSWIARHPIFCGWILFFMGVPLIYCTWLPLLAVPGILVGINWRLKA
jgi:protein-S-isoprenylcysteine O-methyltransferase Ste14